MKKIVFALFSLLIFSCEKQKIIIDTEIWQSPILEKYEISSEYGERGSITDKNGKTITNGEWHRGIDMVTGSASFVYAVKSGVIVSHYPAPNGKFKGHPIYGCCIMISHENGEYSFYAHLSESYVNEGKQVKQGDKIGKIGKTGLATGEHLHFEIGIDPTYILQKTDVKK